MCIRDRFVVVVVVVVVVVGRVSSNMLGVFLSELVRRWQLPVLTWLVMARRGQWTLSVDCGLQRTYQLHSPRAVDSGGRYD